MINRTTLKTFTLTFALGLLGAFFCVSLNTPLPWMIGPLLTTAVLRVAGLDLQVPPGTRQLGQWAIGIALGLYFTPQVTAQLGELIVWVIFGAFAALLMGAASGALLSRLSAVDSATGFFAAMPGGASEMANQAERSDARVDLVAAAHSLRIIVVVIVVPSLYLAFDLHGEQDFVMAQRGIEPRQLLLIAALGALGAFGWSALKQPNAWIIGPLVAAAVLTGGGYTDTALPPAISAAGQLFIGCSLGSRFSRQFIREAPRFLFSSLLITGFLMLISAAFAYGLAQLSHLDTAAVVLGLAPGGIAEMCITAKVMHLAVPIVTAFHVVRAMVVVIFSGPLFSLIYRRQS